MDFTTCKRLLTVLFLICSHALVYAQDADSTVTLVTGSPGDSIPRFAPHSVPLKFINKHPYISLQQYLKGNATGVYVQEPTGEPGTQQNLFVDGISYPLLNKRALFDQQPIVYLNGVPLIQDNPFAYNIQQYEINRIGPANNLLAAINANNIASIKVIRDAAELSALGPLASNGAIWVTTLQPRGGINISFHTYGGMATVPAITPVNAAYENIFRQPFYNKYATINDRLAYPAFLRDSTNADYYGPANWTDLYYKNTPLYNADFSLSAGTERANFRFFGSATQNASGADNTSLSRYNGSFYISVAPIQAVKFTSMINYTRLSRIRNRNITERILEEGYIPDLTNPLTPNKNLYQAYLNQLDTKKSIDDNISNLLQGYLSLDAKIGMLDYNGRVAFDYNENIRDAFWPRTLLEDNNFVSGYFGYNQRVNISNTLGYKFTLAPRHTLQLIAGQNYINDVSKYDYAYGFNGPNDFIKINIVEGDPNKVDYLLPRGFRVSYFPGRTQSALVSFYGNLKWNWNDALQVNAIVRRDGTSLLQPNNKWATNYGAGLEWDIVKQGLVHSNAILSSVVFNASWAKMGKLLSDDRFSAGPHYAVDLGWTGQPTIGSYAGIAGLSRPYTNGWVGYNIPWGYYNKTNIGVTFGFNHDKIMLALNAYNKQDKDMLLPVPVASEWGYTGAYKSGLAVNNKGIDATLHADILGDSRVLGWSVNANIAYNTNKISALPGGLTELKIGDGKLQVGQRVDAFWVWENAGIYNASADVPVNPATSAPITFKGIALKAGDPRWVDVNNDYVIDDKDRVLKGNNIPKIVGGFGNTFSYKALSLDMQFYYALGRNVMNQYAASRLDFINTEANNDINSAKEITYWEKKMDLSTYPQYNPWSPVIPYRANQDLFLDDASFLKLRAATLSVDFSKNKERRVFKKLSQTLLYITGTNLLTITKFKGDDPELATYNGIYTGLGQPLTRTIILGVKINFQK